ncbi:RidA family protein [Camelimonas lactis]|uniref:RidA family protein n=1 Tax=Camelimonas lactis TaxID=659006 RepID=UPI0010504F36|nr:RidA family protein [Camelimonas lactis]
MSRDNDNAGGARSRRRISTGSPFENAWGYSRLVVDGPFAFVAGTTGYDYATMLLPESAAEQARNAWATIGKILREGGFALEDIVRATYYVTSRNDARAVLDVCGAVLAGIRPAATVLIVAGLIEPEMKVEIEVTALRNHG